MITEQHRQRFESKFTRKQNGCFLWKGALDRDGYGSFYLLGKNRRAHRVAYLFGVGAIPAGLVVNHTCGNRACVNAQHLNLLTPAENALQDSRSVAAVNAKKTRCPKGHEYDGTYTDKRGTQRTCSVCVKAKQKRLRKKWSEQDPLKELIGWVGKQ